MTFRKRLGLYIVLCVLALVVLFILNPSIRNRISAVIPSEKVSETLIDIPQISVSEDEVAQWPVYTDEEAGITFRYPPHFHINEGAGCGQYCGRFDGTTIDTIETTEGIYRAVSFGEKQGTDRFIVRVFNEPFNRRHVTAVGHLNLFDQWQVTWKDAKKITLDGKQGYHIHWRDPECEFEHYAFPDKTGQKIVKFSFSACTDSQILVRPYKEAILSTVEFI